MAIDLEAMLAPLSEEAPCGPSLEYDPRYIELEKLSRGVAQEQNAEGKVVREAEPPNWPEVERITLELCGESKDLRVAMYLARARLADAGLPGLREALDLLGGYVSRYWPSVHPQLDPDDNNDPSIRVNTLTALCDNGTFLRELRAAPLVQSRQFGRICYRDYAIANGLITAPAAATAEEKPPDAGRVEAAFGEMPLEQLTATQQAAAGALEAIDGIDSALDEAVGAGNGGDFTPVKKLMGEIKTLLDNQVSKRGAGEAEEPAGAEGVPAAAARGTGGAGPSGAVRNRDDVLLLLDKICRYYSDHEPSSPVPMILNRTKRLVTMSFLDILKDLTPAGVPEFGIVAGIKEEDREQEE